MFMCDLVIMKGREPEPLEDRFEGVTSYPLDGNRMALFSSPAFVVVFPPLFWFWG